MSPLLVRLKQLLSVTTDPVDRAEISAKIASNLARIGEFDEAKETIRNVRQSFGQGESGRVTVWTMLAEGLVHHYENLSPTAMDRIARSLLLGKAMGYDSFVALASAWKAHIEFELSDFTSMIASLAEARRTVAADENDSQTRIAIVLSNSFMICGDRDQGHRWFMAGRESAIRNGDQASVDALLYNKTAFGFAWLRTQFAVGQVPEDGLRMVRLEVESAKNLQNLTGISAFSNHVRLLDARLMIMEKKFEAAVDALRAVRVSGPFGEHNFDQAFVDLEIAFCTANLIGAAVSRSEYSRLTQVSFEGLDIDEQIVATSMLSRLSEAVGDAVQAEVHAAKLASQWSQYKKEHVELRSALVPFEIAS